MTKTLTQRARQRPIRLGFVSRSFTYGGAEHDVIQLITASDPEAVECRGMAVQMPYPLCPDLSLDHPRVPTIYQPGGTATHSKVVSDCSFTQAVAAVAAQSDILIAWGVPDLADVVPLGYSGRIVVTSKASGGYQESFLHDNALLTSDYVGNSVKSTHAFPAPLRRRVQVIYPGIDLHRLQSARNGKSLRAAWGFTRKDRVVGYLGRLAPDKGVEEIVDAVAHMPAPWKVVFVGRNGNFPEYERRLSRLCGRKLPGRHRILDWTTAIGETLAAFDVLAYPTADEGFSNTLAEAWFLGVPTVATRGVGALAEARWSRSSITIPGDFSRDDLSQAILQAFRNEELITRARRSAKRLTVEATLKAWDRYLMGLARKPRRTRVMVLLPNAQIGGIPSWLLTLMRYTPKIDWCCLCVLSELDGYAAHREVLQEVVQRGCPVKGIPPLSSSEIQSRLHRAMRQTRPDIVLQCGVRRLDDCYPQTRIPLVTVSHGPVDCDWARDVLANSSRRARHRVAVSTTARKAFPARLRRDVPIIANGVEVPTSRQLSSAARRRARRRMDVASDEVAVGFVGRLSPEKNPLCLARAMDYLPTQYRAVFIGPDCADYSSQIQRLTSRFRYLGLRPPEEVRSLYLGLDVVVCTSDYESFGLAIVEAWAAKVPVVSTRVGVVAELSMLDVAVLVPRNATPRVLARAIQQALAERDKRVPRCRNLARSDYNARRMGREWQEYLYAVAKAGANAAE